MSGVKGRDVDGPGGMWNGQGDANAARAMVSSKVGLQIVIDAARYKNALHDSCFDTVNDLEL